MTITQGISLVEDGADDYVIVLQYPSAGAAGETWPIAVDKGNVHLIGGNLFGASPLAWIAPPGDTASFVVTGTAVEIAGFDLGAGATHGCIENSGTVWRAHIHHCDFALIRTAQDGLRLTGAVDCPHWLIENNQFGLNIVRDGIRIEHNSTRSVIRNNYFDVASGAVGMHCQGLCSGGMVVFGNRFKVTDNAAGEGITLTNANCNAACDGNSAFTGKGAMGNIPWVDGGGGSWGFNTVTAAPSACIMPA